MKEYMASGLCQLRPQVHNSRLNAHLRAKGEKNKIQGLDNSRAMVLVVQNVCPKFDKV